jgi:beta-lactamase regulating signal transducer with metallopeptidase domain
MIAGLLDHLWQSTLFAAGAGLLTLTLRHNSARLRFRLWFAASLKFLLPFALLTALGERLSRFFPQALPRAILVLQPAAERFSAPVRALVPPQSEPASLVPFLVTAWLAGIALVLGVRLIRWSRLHAMLGNSQSLALTDVARVDVRASDTLLEPGLVGIWKPVVVLPLGLMARLSDPECAAILAHELGHLARRDNLTAAIHMLVEALFWFYPPVWLIGARLIAERERACDESVLAQGHDPEVYSSSILKVCKFCIQSPLACAPGASGANLSNRVREIMSGNPVRKLRATQRLLLASAVALALGLPLAGGFLDMNTPLAVAVRLHVASVRSQMAAGFGHVTAVARDISAPVPAPLPVRRLPRLKLAVPQASPAPQPDQAPSIGAPFQPEPIATVAAPLVQGGNDLDRAVASSTAPEFDYPTGEGALVAISCRTPKPLPDGSPGPKLCMHNHYWALLRSAGLELSADGKNTFNAAITRRS